MSVAPLVFIGCFAIVVGFIFWLDDRKKIVKKK